MTNRAIDQLAESIVADGFEPHAAAVRELLDAAREQGVCPILVDIVADVDAPLPARERALGHILRELRPPRSTHVDTAPDRDHQPSHDSGEPVTPSSASLATASPE